MNANLATAGSVTGRAPNPGETPPSHCQLAHKVFTTPRSISFRRSTGDGTPVAVLPFGEREATVSLRALAREFAIPDDCADGQMLALIAQSLDYVTGLRLGDPLPAEVLTGRASWMPGPVHRRIAAARLRLQLVAWLDPSAARAEGDASGALQLLDLDSTARHRVQQAFEQAAKCLGLPGPEDVVPLVEDLEEELAYIESLRESLLQRAASMAMRIEAAGQGWRGDINRLETLTQVQRLMQTGLRQMAMRFDQVDANTGEVMTALRHADRHRSFIRGHRDWLYRSQRAWTPILDAWEVDAETIGRTLWSLIGSTYRFLAPRFMPVKEWLATPAGPGTPGKQQPAVMLW
jgi:hypothetical protein